MIICKVKNSDKIYFFVLSHMIRTHNKLHCFGNKNKFECVPVAFKSVKKNRKLRVSRVANRTDIENANEMEMEKFKGNQSGWQAMKSFTGTTEAMYV